MPVPSAKSPVGLDQLEALLAKAQNLLEASGVRNPPDDSPLENAEIPKSAKFRKLCETDARAQNLEP